MFRRKTRNSTAYTGVGLAAPSAQAPDNSAMAAALTIGQNLKQTRPEIYGKANATPLMTRYGPPKPTLSLLKRSSSIQSSTGSFGPGQNRTGLTLSNRHSMAPAGNRQVYNIDDSFNDSFFEEVGHETDAHYSNEAQLRDLKLHHQPRASAPVKMVKKYIPTPNGITVIEVPEETMKKEIARSNSMRSGLSVGRAGLLRSHSMTNAAKAKKPNRLRLSSLVNAPRIDEQSELDYQYAQSPRSASHASAELESLKRQIEHEKQLAKDLERQRAEYEQLKKLRLENERKFRELQSLQEEEPESFKDLSSLEEKTPVSNNKTGVCKAAPAVVTNVTHGHLENKKDSDSEEDVPIAPLPFVVDELDLKKHTGPTEQDDTEIEDTIDLYAAHEDEEKEFTPTSTSSHDALVNSYGDTFVPLNELEKDSRAKESNDNFGIEEIPNESFESPNLATQLRPTFVSQNEKDKDSMEKPVNNISYEFGVFTDDNDAPEAAPSFDPVPEIICPPETSSPKTDRTRDASNESALAPPNFAGSIRSFSSVDSKSKPIKSAMKNAKPAYSSKNNGSESPAHQAYLSLTTAENTRLNSKLSAAHLNEPGLAPEAKPQAPKSPNNQQKRISQSLRKQPSAASQNGLAGRSLRPQSMVDNQPGRAQGNGMSNRNLKHTPQPIAPHPISKPNYQSPSKLKAAELYAKANKRPISEFKPIPRKSSFTRDAEVPQNAQSQVPQRSSHRMTLRAPPQAPQAPTQVPIVQNGRSQQQFGGSNFRSKFADSDDEHGSGIGGFLSRFADSDDESPRILSSQRHTSSSPIKSLRKKEEKPQEEPAPKEKKPKKKFLKKLFGRN